MWKAERKGEGGMKKKYKISMEEFIEKFNEFRDWLYD